MLCMLTKQILRRVLGNLCQYYSFCFTVELRSNYKEIMGVLWRLDPVIGDFPLGAEPRNTKFSSICGQQTVSH